MPRRLALALALLSTSCAYRAATVRLPAPLALAPHFLTTEVSVTQNANPADAADAEYIHTLAHKMIREATPHGTTSGRVQIKVDLGGTDDYLAFLHQDGIGAVIVVWPVLGGMVIEREEVGVDVTIETEGRTLHGHGVAAKSGSLYAKARRRALAVALNLALADAAEDYLP